MVTKKENSGFTLLELLVTITIIGILAASVTYGVADYVKEKRSEQHVVSLWSELSTLRARAIKDDRPYLVVLDDNANSYTIYANDAGTTVDYLVANSTQISNGFMNVNGKLEFGFPTPTPDPLTIGAHTYSTSNAIQDEWLADNTTAPTALAKTIVFSSDEIGSINDGALFIKNTSLKNRGYAIVKARSTHTLKLWKWNGSQWYEM